jgi:hypothetical protein
MSRIRIYMGICSTGDRIDLQTYLFRDLQERYGDRVELVFPDECIHRIFHDRARNDVVEEFLASGCDVLWFLDSDVCPPKTILDLIVNHWDKWQVAGAPYPLWMVPPGSAPGSGSCVLYTAYKGVVEGAKAITMAAVPYSGTDWVDALATGCMFIKREVFASLSKPYFEFKFDQETRRITEGEDLGFCLKLHKLGIKCFIDYGMVCKHYKRVCLLDVQNYATDMSNSKVLQYDAEIRSQVEAACRAAYEKGKQDAQLAASVTQSARKSGLILPKNL